MTTLVVVGLFGGYFYYLTITGKIKQNPISKTIITAVRPYPALTNPRELILTCDYHGKNLTVSETLYGSLYDYYRTDPSKKSAYLHGKDKDFIFSYTKDGAIKDLASKISVVGAENNLSNDQTVDLAACFLQNIPYDDVKATKILGPDFAKQPIDQVIPRYPYETLYDKLGICTDKSYLGNAIMGELGYETAIMTFDTQKHMSLGIAVPDGYGSFGTKYGIMELTGSGFLVGDIPDISASAGTAINTFQTLPQGDSTTSVPIQLQLSNPTNVLNISSGLVYTRISDRTATRQKLEELKPTLAALQTSYKQAQNKLNATETELSAAEQAYKNQSTQANYNAYTTIYNKYLTYYNDAQSKINQYNNTVNLYNSYVEKYRQF